MYNNKKIKLKNNIIKFFINNILRNFKLIFDIYFNKSFYFLTFNNYTINILNLYYNYLSLLSDKILNFFYKKLLFVFNRLNNINTKNFNMYYSFLILKIFISNKYFLLFQNNYKYNKLKKKQDINKNFLLNIFIYIIKRKINNIYFINFYKLFNLLVNLINIKNLSNFLSKILFHLTKF